MEFRYRARDAEGKTVSGTLDAPDRKGAVRVLRARRVQPVEVSPLKGGGRATRAPMPSASGGNSVNGGGTTPPIPADKAGKEPKPGRKPRDKAPAPDRAALEQSDARAATETAAKPSKPLFSFGKGEKKLSRKAALPFLSKLHQLHSSGMPLGDSVNLMAQRLTDPGMKQLADTHWRELSEGHTLAASMRRRTDVYDSSLGYLVEAGEATGNLAPILSDIIEYLEQVEELERTIKRKLAYPIFLVLMGLGVGIFIVTFLLPRIQGMIEKMGDQMTTSAALLIGLSEGAVIYGPWIVLSLFFAVLGFFQWRKSDNGRWTTDKWLMRIPLIGAIVRCSEVCRVSNVIAALLQNGVNTTETLRLAENTIKNQPMRAQFAASRQLINDGAPFSAAFKRHAFFDEMDIDILSVGENTGSLVTSFKQIFTTQSRALSEHFDKLIKGLTTIAMATALSFVALIVFSVVTSVLQLSASLQAR
ncbi:MAG: type II secretion system F family protein [Opitutales bacterium]